MPSGLHFLVASRQCEIGELEQLAHTSAVVDVISQFTHALQRERGISNVFLASRGRQFAAQREAQVQQCAALELQVRACFDTLDTEATRLRNGARLFSRIAFVLHALDALPALRERIAGLTADASQGAVAARAPVPAPQEAVAAYSRLVAGLLAVVFEAADSATDPTVSRALVALFNFMQGKEFAGQERAHGAAAFALGGADAAQQQQWQHLIDSQERCFQVFMDFTQAPLLAAWQACQLPAQRTELERLRRIGYTARAQGLRDPSLSSTWYACCTLRIDAMRGVEERLAADLRAICEQKVTEERAALRDQQLLLAQLPAPSAGTPPHSATAYGPQLERSILGLVQEQAQRLQAMGDELDTVRAALTERKVVERAKGLLMATRKLSEEEAFKMLRKTAMNQNRKIAEVAESVLAMAEFL
jgi:hypothetical protein